MCLIPQYQSPMLALTIGRGNTQVRGRSLTSKPSRALMHHKPQLLLNGAIYEWRFLFNVNMRMYVCAFISNLTSVNAPDQHQHPVCTGTVCTGTLSAQAPSLHWYPVCTSTLSVSAPSLHRHPLCTGSLSKSLKNTLFEKNLCSAGPF